MNKTCGTISLDWNVCLDGALVFGGAGPGGSVGVALVRQASAGSIGRCVAATMLWFGADDHVGRTAQLAPGRYRVAVALFDAGGRVLDHHASRIVEVTAGQDTYLGRLTFVLDRREALRGSRTRTLRGHVAAA
jgi:hypothetical protein